MSERSIAKTCSDSNPASLTYWTFNDKYPLHSNAAILVAGNCGSGKSWFTYNYLLPIYIKYAGVKTVIVASRTGQFDYTKATALEKPIYKDVGLEFIKIEQTYNKCQMIRADAIINEYLLKLMKIQGEQDLVKISKELAKLIKNVNDFEIVHSELSKLLSIIHKFMSIEPDEVRDYAEMLYKRGTQLTYNPIVVVFDDYSGCDDFIKPYSSVHKLIYCHRHLHLNMIMLVQSITTISTNIRRNVNIFICFSTLSDRDIQLLRDRLPLKWDLKRIREEFFKIADADDRDDKVLTLFTTFPRQCIITGTPDCLKALK